MPEDTPDWEEIVASPFYPTFLDMLVWFETQAVKMTCVADTESKLYTAQGELRAFHGMQMQIESRAAQMRDARLRKEETRNEENTRDETVANRRGSAGGTGSRGSVTDRIRDRLDRRG